MRLPSKNLIGENLQAYLKRSACTLKEMLDAGAIRESESPYSSNVLVKKRDGSLRFCIDFRKLNSRTIRDSYNLPPIDYTIDTLIGAKYFTKLGTVHYLSVGWGAADIQSQHQNFARPPPPLEGHKNTMTPLDTVSYFA